MIKVAHAKSGPYGVEVGLGDEGIYWEYAFALGSEGLKSRLIILADAPKSCANDAAIADRDL